MAIFHVISDWVQNTVALAITHTLIILDRMITSDFKATSNFVMDVKKSVKKCKLIQKWKEIVIKCTNTFLS